MPQIDRYIDALFQHQAEALVMAAGEKASLRIEGKLRQLASPPPALKELDEVLAEIAPASLREDLEQDGDHAITYASPKGGVQVEVKRLGELLRIEIRPGNGTTAEPAEIVADAMVETASANGLDGPAECAGTNGVGEDWDANGAAGANGAADPMADVAAPAEPTPAAATPAAVETPATPGVQVTAEEGEATVTSSEKTARMDAFLREMVANDCSDLHLSSCVAPLFRKDGSIVSLTSHEPFDPRELREILFSITPPMRQREFDERRDSDFSYELPGLARFRCNLFMDRNGIGGVFRQIPAEVLTAEQLNLPDSILNLCELHKGLVVVTGPTGSGKSTTLAAMVNHINERRTDHIITIEDPIEFVHPNKKCLINQREVENHTLGFKPALRAALREDPDIVLVGEMRDLETVEIAIETAETGHLVFGTLHTNTAPSTVDRIIDQFSTDRQGQIRTMLSESLKGVVAQTLCKKKGGGRVAALEILLITPAVSNLIREGKTFQIPSAMQTGRKIGMQTLNDALLQLVKDDLVEPNEAYAKAVAREELRTMLQAQGFQVDVSDDDAPA